MHVVKGDLIKLFEDGKFDVIAHGCNCFCTMGAGIAKQLRKKYPQIYEADLQTKSGDLYKLGSYTAAEVVKQGRSSYIYNLYTQYGYGGNIKHAEYSAIRSSLFGMIYSLDVSKRYNIGLPLIGCGLGGCDKDIVYKIVEGFDKACDYCNFTMVEFNG